MSSGTVGGKRVVIVGGGVIGLSAAWYAAERGHAVTVLERGAPDHNACSLGNAGMVVPSHFIPLAAPGMVALGLRMMRDPKSPFYVRPRLDPDLLAWGVRFARAANAGHVARSAPLLRDLNLASRAAYEDLAARFGEESFGLTRRGLLMLCKTRHALDEEAKTAEAARALGMPAEVLTPDELARLDPGVRMDVAGGVHFPLDCHLSPQAFVARLTEELVSRSDVEIRFSSEVTGWRTDHHGRMGRVTAARTPHGDVTGDEFVLAGGSWSHTLARGLSLRLPMQAGKGYSLTLTAPRQQPCLCSILTEARVAVTPMGKSLRFGGTMEIAGMDETVRPERVQGIIESVPRYFPDFRPEDFDDVPVWTGLRPCSPDGLPYLGRFRRWPNVIAATGHAMMGLSLAPVTGKLVASLLSDERPEIDLTLLNPDRYG